MNMKIIPTIVVVLSFPGLTFSQREKATDKIKAGSAEMTRADIGDYNRIGQNARFFDSQPARPDAAK
jgi:hypothetical protein